MPDPVIHCRAFFRKLPERYLSIEDRRRWRYNHDPESRIEMHRILILAIMATFLTVSVFSLPVSQEILPLGSPVYVDMDTLYTLTGLGTPSNSRPWSKTEAALILGRIDRARLTEISGRLYDSIAEIIEPGLRFRFPDGFGFGTALNTYLEAYVHSNTGYKLESDWMYGFEERKPIARISLDFSVGDFFYTYCDLQYGRNLFSYLDTRYEATDAYPAGIAALIAPADTQALLVSDSIIYGAPFLTNFFQHSYNFDFQWPKRAIASIGGASGEAGWNIVMARDKISWGNGHSGNFIIDDHVDYHEFARFTAFSDIFKYEWLNVFFETGTAPVEHPDTDFKVFMAHRLEFRIYETITFAVSENVMYQSDSFDARYLNPAFIYHNLNNRSIFNAIAHAELDWNLFPGWNVYAQFVLDQARAPNESAAQSGATGYLGGIELASEAGPGILSMSLEGALTDPVLYRRDGVDLLMFRKYFTHGEIGPGFILNLDYIGYEYGGDALVLEWNGNWKIPGLGAIGAGVFGMRHGEMDFFVSHNLAGDNAGYADYDGATPSGDSIAETLAASLFAEARLAGLFGLIDAEAWINLDWVHRWIYQKPAGIRDYSGNDLQLTLGCSVSL